jgi:hypothetical protein
MRIPPDSVISSLKSIMNLVIPDLLRDQAIIYLSTNNARGLNTFLAETLDADIGKLRNRYLTTT